MRQTCSWINLILNPIKLSKCRTAMNEAQHAWSSPSPMTTTLV